MDGVEKGTIYTNYESEVQLVQFFDFRYIYQIVKCCTWAFFQVQRKYHIVLILIFLLIFC